jgi:acetoacetyl-CoA reductase
MRRAALVTGGGRGIGRAVVDALSDEAWVAALDLAFPEGPGRARRTLVADVRDQQALTEAVGAVVAETGGLDCLVCAAGIIRDRVSWKMSRAEWDDVLAVNLTGAFAAAQAAIPALRRSAGGRVVFISSINGLRGKFGQANYAAAKAGLIGLARSLALELARDGVTVNVIAPGYIDTPMTRGIPDTAREEALASIPLGRLGRAEEVAAVARFLCSEGASFVTGATVVVDGGQLLGPPRSGS